MKSDLNELEIAERERLVSELNDPRNSPFGRIVLTNVCRRLRISRAGIYEKIARFEISQEDVHRARMGLKPRNVVTASNIIKLAGAACLLFCIAWAPPPPLPKLPVKKAPVLSPKAATVQKNAVMKSGVKVVAPPSPSKSYVGNKWAWQGFTVQSSPSLDSPVWTTVATNAPGMELTVTNTGNFKYFRLNATTNAVRLGWMNSAGAASTVIEGTTNGVTWYALQTNAVPVNIAFIKQAAAGWSFRAYHIGTNGLDNSDFSNVLVQSIPVPPVATIRK